MLVIDVAAVIAIYVLTYHDASELLALGVGGRQRRRLDTTRLQIWPL